MKQQTIEKLEYTDKDIEKLIYDDICKRYPKTLRQRVKIRFELASHPDDGPGFPTYYLNCANVEVDVTQ
jgi:hypothetical protein